MPNLSGLQSESTQIQETVKLPYSLNFEVVRNDEYKFRLPASKLSGLDRKSFNVRHGKDLKGHSVLQLHFTG